MFVNQLQTLAGSSCGIDQIIMKIFPFNRKTTPKFSFEVTQRLWLLFKMVKKLLGKFYFAFVRAFFSVQLIKLAAILTPRHVLTQLK